MEIIEAERWSGPLSLQIRAQGSGSFLDVTTERKMGFNLIYHVTVAVDEGSAVISSVAREHYAKSEFK